MTKSEQRINPHGYESFLLRLWSATSETEDSPQRFMLRSVATGETFYFPDLATLVAFLQRPIARRLPMEPDIDNKEASQQSI